MSRTREEAIDKVMSLIGHLAPGDITLTDAQEIVVVIEVETLIAFQEWLREQGYVIYQRTTGIDLDWNLGTDGLKPDGLTDDERVDAFLTRQSSRPVVSSGDLVGQHLATKSFTSDHCKKDKHQICMWIYGGSRCRCGCHSR